MATKKVGDSHTFWLGFDYEAGNGIQDYEEASTEKGLSDWMYKLEITIPKVHGLVGKVVLS